jgi:hypothetical protein
MAGIPAERRSGSSPKLASAMIARALDADTPAAWVNR